MYLILLKAAFAVFKTNRFPASQIVTIFPLIACTLSFFVIYFSYRTKPSWGMVKMNANSEENLKKAKDKPGQEPQRQRVKSDEKCKQISAIKARLNTELIKFKDTGGSIYALLNILEKEYKFNLSYDTLNKTLSTGNTTTLDLFCVLAATGNWIYHISCLRQIVKKSPCQRLIP